MLDARSVKKPYAFGAMLVVGIYVPNVAYPAFFISETYCVALQGGRVSFFPDLPSKEQQKKKTLASTYNLAKNQLLRLLVFPAYISVKYRIGIRSVILAPRQALRVALSEHASGVRVCYPCA